MDAGKIIYVFLVPHSGMQGSVENLCCQGAAAERVLTVCRRPAAGGNGKCVLYCFYWELFVSFISLGLFFLQVMPEAFLSYGFSWEWELLLCLFL